MSNSATVHIIDDDPCMRSLLQVLLASVPMPIQLHESADDFLHCVNLEQPGCILLDLQMPGVDGIELLCTLAMKRCDMSVIIISGQLDISLAVRTMALGAMDVLQKPIEVQALLSSIQRAISQSKSTHRVRSDQASVRQRFASLTTRETELLQFLVAGNSNKEIANTLCISVKTVCNHRASLMAKTCAANGPDLVRLCMVARVLPDRC